MAEQLYIEAKLDAQKFLKDLENLKNKVDSTPIKLNVELDGKFVDVANKVEAGAKKVEKGMGEVVKKTKEQANEMLNVSDIFKKAEQTMAKFGPGFKASAKNIMELEDGIKTLKEALKSVSGEAAEPLRIMLMNMQQTLLKARKEFRSFGNEVEKTTKQSAGFMDGLSRSIKTGLLTTFGAFSIAGAIGKGIRNFRDNIRESMDTAISFESAFAGVRKTIDATEYEFQKFNNQLKDMSLVIPRTYEDLAKIAELGGQMGIPLEQLGKFVEALAGIEVSTDMGLEEAALQFARIANVTGIAFSDVDRLGSAVVDLGNNFAATESEITNFMQRIAGTGSLVGLSVGDIAGIGAAMTSVGIAAEKGGTSVNKMLIAIENAVNDGGDKLNKFAQLTGKTAEEFRKNRKESAGDLFVDVVEGLAKAGPQATHYLNDLVGGGVRLQETFLNMAAAGDTLRTAMETGNRAYAENLALMEEAGKRYGTMESQLQILDNELRLHKEEIGQELLPVLVGRKRTLLELQDTLKRLIVGFKGFIDSVSAGEMTAFLGALTAGLLMLAPPLGLIVGGLSALMIYFKKFKDEGLKGVSPALKEIQDSLKGVNEQISENERLMDELTQRFYDGKISVGEYNRELAELIEKKKELEGVQKEYIQQMAAEKEIADMISRSYDIVNTKQKEFIDAQKSYDAANTQLDGLKKQLMELESIDVSLLKEGDLDKMKELRKEIEDVSVVVEKYGVEVNSAEQSFNKYAQATRDSVPALELFNKYAGNQEELMRAINSIKYDTSGNVEEMNNFTRAVTESTKKTAENIQAQLSLLQLYFKSRDILESDGWLTKSRKIVLTGWDMLRGKFQENEQAVEDLNTELSQLGQTVEDMAKGFQTVGAMEVEDALKFEIDGRSKSELQQHLANLSYLQDRHSSASKARKDMQAERVKANIALQKLLDAEEEGLKDQIKNAKSAGDAKKAQIRLLELEAMRRIQLAKENLSNEESIAKEILAINERLSEEKKKLNEDWVSLEVDGANKIIKKYEEMRKAGEKALSGLAKDVESTSKEIEKLVEKIKSLNEKLADLDTSKTDDLGKRYTTIQKEIDKLNEKIAEVSSQLETQGEEGKTVLQIWDELQDSIKNATKEVENYTKEIDKIKEKMEDLNKSEVDKLSDRYAKVTEEIERLNKELEVYTKYDILTDVDAKKKLELEEEINTLLYEQAKIRQTLRPDQLVRAEAMVGETETDKIIREANEKRKAYQIEVDEYEAKLSEQQSLLESYKEQELSMAEEYDYLVVESDEKKYQELLKNLKEYTDERNRLLSEQAQLETLLSAQEIQEAINKSKRTETQIIMEKYYLEKDLLDKELADYQDQLKRKLMALSAFYGDAAKMQAEYGKLGISFSQEDMEKIASSAGAVQSLGAGDKDFLNKQTTLQQSLLKEQEEAKDKLKIIAEQITKLTDSQLSKFGEENLRKMYEEIAKLKITASGTALGTQQSNVSNSVTNNQTFNLASHLDVEAIARKIRLATRI